MNLGARREPATLGDQPHPAPAQPHPAPALQAGAVAADLVARHRAGRWWRWLFQVSTIVGIVALTALLYTVIVQSFGLVAVQDTVDPAGLAVDGAPLEQLSKEQLIAVLTGHVSAGVLRRLESERPFAERSREDIYAVVIERVVEPQILASWSLSDSLLRRPAILAEMAQAYPGARLEWRAWLNLDFLRRSQSSTPALAGVRTALLGSLWTIAITILVAFPLGVGAAIYLEEYARDSAINRIIQTNINNLAGVPSIIYGMLGLALFVRALKPLTSGALLGVAADLTTANGRTILSAALTLALLVLPLLIINAQEAIRAVPRSLRDASYALGATRWQTIWHHVLPNALPGILTGTILAISRAIGETAPLVVVGAATFIAVDPSGPFEKFTTLPIQVYQWTTRPQDQFRNIAAAAILVLLVLLLALNASAILLRNRYSRRLL